MNLFVDFLKLTIYLTFFMLVLTFYGLPLNMIRDVYITARSFIVRTRDLMRYRTATRNMDERYPNATVEEMNAMSDKTCIICREEMSLADPNNTPQNGSDTPQGPNMTPKKLPCGHFFHFVCQRGYAILNPSLLINTTVESLLLFLTYLTKFRSICTFVSLNSSLHA